MSRSEAGASTALQQGSRPRRRQGARSSSPSRASATVSAQSASPGRLRSLLVVLAITTLLLVVMQSYRAFYGPIRLGKRAAQAQTSAVGAGIESDDSWRSYLATMRKHFDEEIDKVKEARGVAPGKPATGGGMAPIPGQGVRDHPIDKPVHVDGKSSLEADEDRRVALEDIDQETLKAMYDALHEAGVRL